jgi:hypothetical protein
MIDRKIFNEWFRLPLLEDRIATITDEELEFRGWTRESIRTKYYERLEQDKLSHQIGDVVPDFELQIVNNSGKIKLSDLYGKPVGLIFGSYTCPPFRHWSYQIIEIISKFCDKVNFLVVYIKDAHTTDGSQAPDNLDIYENVLFKQPTTLNERAELATICKQKLNFSCPMVIDDMDNSIQLQYCAYPERLYLLDATGCVFYKSVKGTYGFNPDKFESAIDDILDV